MSHFSVIGGGPAGSSAAIRLARAGQRVQLYEKATFPRPKLCGGFLSPESLADLEDLGILGILRRLGALPIRRTVVASARGTISESSLPGEALSVSRDILDNLLLNEARRSGAEVVIGQDGFSQSHQSDYVVIATGRLSNPRQDILKAHLTPWYSRPAIRYVGIQAFFEGVQDMTDQVELDLVKGGYVGLVRQKAGVNLCALLRPDVLQRFGPAPDAVLRRFIEENPVLRRHLRDARRTSDWLSVGPVRYGIRALAEGNTFYIGDAACVVDPFAGEGMAMGLMSSRLLVRALEQGRQPAATYQRLWRQAFMPVLRWNAVIRAIFETPAFYEPVLRLFQHFPRGLSQLTHLTRSRPVENPA